MHELQSPISWSLVKRPFKPRDSGDGGSEQNYSQVTSNGKCLVEGCCCRLRTNRSQITRKWVFTERSSDPFSTQQFPTQRTRITFRLDRI